MRAHALPIRSSAVPSSRIITEQRHRCIRSRGPYNSPCRSGTHALFCTSARGAAALRGLLLSFRDEAPHHGTQARLETLREIEHLREVLVHGLTLLVHDPAQRIGNHG